MGLGPGPGEGARGAVVRTETLIQCLRRRNGRETRAEPDTASQPGSRSMGTPCFSFCLGQPCGPGPTWVQEPMVPSLPVRSGNLKKFGGCVLALVVGDRPAHSRPPHCPQGTVPLLGQQRGLPGAWRESRSAARPSCARQGCGCTGSVRDSSASAEPRGHPPGHVHGLPCPVRLPRPGPDFTGLGGEGCSILRAARNTVSRDPFLLQTKLGPREREHLTQKGLTQGISHQAP